MLAVLAANPYLGLEDANFKEVYGLLTILGSIFAFLLIYRLLGIFFSARKEKKASLNTFLVLARTRGLSNAQTEFLAIVARRAKVKRPPRILESIEYFDKVFDRFQNQVGLSEKQLILAESIRKKLVTTKVRWNTQLDERRQLTRASCSWNAHIIHIDRETIEKEVSSFAEDDGKFKEAIVAFSEENNGQELSQYKVQIRDISAGGVSLLASSTFDGTIGDYALLRGQSQRIPFSMENLCGQICSIEKDEERDCLILHYRFLLVEAELRKSIIQFVFARNQKKTTKKTAQSKQIYQPGEG